MKTLHVELTESSLNKAIQELDQYQKTLEEKAKRICERLATMGATNVSLGFARAIYNGNNAGVAVTVEATENGYRILAEGEAVLFIEFGAGVSYGYGHPKAAEFGYGPGTWPGEGHWDDPNGWWIPKANGGGHTYGNPPNMPMYNTAKDLEKEVARVAQEVFAS